MVKVLPKLRSGLPQVQLRFDFFLRACSVNCGAVSDRTLTDNTRQSVL